MRVEGMQATFGYWNKNINCNWGVTTSLDSVMRQLEIGSIYPFPNLHNSPALVVASDYGGQHRGSAYESFSFLIAGHSKIASWNNDRRRLRSLYFLDGRRMSYKALNDNRRRRALRAFLKAADLLPGLLVTVLVHKAFSALHRVTADERVHLPSTFSAWSSQSLVKMTFISHLGSLFIAGLAAPGQNVIWLTDDDDFVANDKRVIDVTAMIAGIISGYVGHDLGHFKFGTTRCDPGDLQIEDLAAIPDLVSGAACELPLDSVLRTQSIIRVPLSEQVSPKAFMVLNWMGQKHEPLKRILLAVDIGDGPSMARVRCLDLYPEPSVR